jgi:hypothetical protein
MIYEVRLPVEILITVRIDPDPTAATSGRISRGWGTEVRQDPQDRQIAWCASDDRPGQIHRRFATRQLTPGMQKGAPGRGYLKTCLKSIPSRRRCFSEQPGVGGHIGFRFGRRWLCPVGISCGPGLLDQSQEGGGRVDPESKRIVARFSSGCQGAVRRGHQLPPSFGTEQADTPDDASGCPRSIARTSCNAKPGRSLPAGQPRG